MKKNVNVEETLIVAYQNHQKNNLNAAEQLYKEVLKKIPGHTDAMFFLGTVSAQLKKFDIAIKLLSKVIKISPNYVHAYINLGNTYKEIKENNKAINCYEKAIEIEPKLLSAYDNLGIIFKELGELQKAANYYEKATQIEPNYVEAYNNRGLIFQELDKHQEAIKCFEKAIKIQNNYVHAHNNLGIAFQELGKFNEAANCYKKAFKYDPKNLVYLYQFSLLKKKVLDLKLKHQIEEIVKDINCTKKNLAYGNFLLAKYELTKKNHKNVFNLLIRAHKNYFDSQSEKFTKGVRYYLHELPKIKKLLDKNSQKVDSKLKPIFIVGMPRSGSTLIEKLISSGSKLIPIGEETNIFGNLVGKNFYQIQNSNLDITSLQKNIIQRYKQKDLIQQKSNFIFTDKSLDNFFYIGLINKIFPHAKVIDCSRSALSSIMSILQNNLIEIPWAHSLENIFKYFDIYYQIIDSYKNDFPNFIYELKFEKFVKNPEKESKKLFKFCNLSWNKKCLEFYKRNDFISKTTSNIQIRKSIYQDLDSKYLPYKHFLNEYRSKYNWFR